jgi:hypothetical protein
MPLVTPAVALLLVAAPLAAAAHEPPVGATGRVNLQADAPGFEAGVSTSLIAIFPGFGGFVSVPAGRRISLEAGIETYPWMIEDGDNLRLLTQVQARIPWKANPRSRWSFIAGVTAATLGDNDAYDGAGNRYDGDWEFQTNYLPHGGVSWQWQNSPRLDVRLDVTAMLAVAPIPIPVPKVQFSMVWHTRRGAR